MVIGWQISGLAGYGLQTASEFISKLAMKNGYYAYSYSEFPSRIKGGYTNGKVMLDSKPVNSVKKKLDILIPLTIEAAKKDKELMTTDTILILDSAFEVKHFTSRNVYQIPISAIAEKIGNPIFKNSVATGASIALLGLDLDLIYDIVREKFSKKDKKIIEQNISAIDQGYYAMRDLMKDRKKKSFGLVKQKKKNNILVNGNTATAIGAITSGLKFYSAYPMTPASGILNYLAQKGKDYEIVVKQTEDELAAINMAIGASYAGVRAMTGTSGGGFSLMTEAFGLAACAEIPLVVCEVQRPGPSTGLPTWTSQADLKFMIHASQGEFPRIILTPGDIKESFELISKALNYADKYQIPVIFLSDKLLAESEIVVSKKDLEGKIEIDRGQLVSNSKLKKLKAKEYFARYDVNAKHGISKRTIPGQENGIYIAVGDEHDEFGGITEDSCAINNMVEKRMKKMELIKKEMPKPQVYSRGKNVIVSFGSNKGVLLDTLADKKNISYVHITHVWPFPGEFLEKFCKGKNVYVVEANYEGQLCSLISEFTKLKVKKKLLKYDGRPFYREEIEAFVKKIK